MSKSWVDFVKELEVKCKEQGVSLLDLVEWFRTLIEQIEKKAFDYYITSVSTPEFPEQLLDIIILVDNRFQGFTIFKKRKEYYLYPITSLLNFTETIIGDLIVNKFFMSEMVGFQIADEIANSAKLRKFARQALNLAWGSR